MLTLTILFTGFTQVSGQTTPSNVKASKQSKTEFSTNSIIPEEGNWSANLSQSNFAATAQRAFVEKRKQFENQPTNAEAGWQFAKACFDWAEFATNNAQRAGLAEQGIAASRQALAATPHSAPTHYYLGMNLGQLARTKSLGALKLVGQMEHEFAVARDLNEHFDHAGPDRNLGLLYRDAPAIASVGSRSKARQHLRRSAALEPDFPENRLNLIESYLKWGDRNGASSELAALEALWPAARTNLTGAAWAPSWADWQTRLNNVKKKTEEPLKPQANKSSHRP